MESKIFFEPRLPQRIEEIEAPMLARVLKHLCFKVAASSRVL
jgi:hypothetical protein